MLSVYTEPKSDLASRNVFPHIDLPFHFRYIHQRKPDAEREGENKAVYDSIIYFSQSGKYSRFFPCE